MSSASAAVESLADLAVGQSGVVDRLELPPADARRLMELGFLPGSSVLKSRRTPFGDPTVFRVDDSDIALRRETAERIVLRSRT